MENVNETERNPTEAGIERFVGLEHLEPGSLHIRSWGNVADGTTFTRRCRPGQVLFGKRRAYQRKVAVAEFDAVVSGDIYVLAANHDRLLPELLPFVCYPSASSTMPLEHRPARCPRARTGTILRASSSIFRRSISSGVSRKCFGTLMRSRPNYGI
ncbi:MAG: hypothetical protein ACREUZ_07225 [Burkholderiales bacterium]